MHTDRPDPDLHPVAPLNHPAAQFVLDRADVLDQASTQNQIPVEWRGLLDLVATIMRREAHLCTFHWIELRDRNTPPDTALTLAQDDMGFQLAHALAERVGD